MNKISMMFHQLKEKVIFVIFSLLFSLLAIGGMQLLNEEFGLTPYPTEQIMVVKVSEKTSSDSKEFYEELRNIAETDNINIIKTVMDESGKSFGYVFGKPKAGFKDSKLYTSDETLLVTTTIQGNYYIDNKLSSKIREKIESLNVGITTYNTPIWYVSATFLTGSNVYSLSFFTMLLKFFVVVYAFLVNRMKEVAIERSFGVFHRRNVQRVLQYISLTWCSLFVFGIIFSYYFGYFGTVKIKAYLLTLFLMATLISLLLMFVYFLFFLQVRFSKISEIQKNKISGKYTQVIWLMVIAITTVTVTIEAATIFNNYPKYLSQKHLTTEWELAKDYTRIWWGNMEVNDKGTKEESIKKQQEKDKNMMDFARSFSSEQVILSKQTHVQASETGMMWVWDENKGETEEKKVDAKLAKRIYTVNPNVLKLNEKIHSQNNYAIDENKAVTIFIPKKYADRKQEIQLIALEGLNRMVKEGDISIQIIPDNQNFFLFFMESDSDISLPESDKKDTILVSLDWNKLPQNEDTNFLIGNLTFDALYYSKGLQEKAKKYNVLEEVYDFLNVKMALDEMSEYLNRQFISGIVLLIVLFIFQLFVIYDFLKMQIQFYSKQIIVQTIMGKNLYVSILRYQILLPIVLLLVEVFSFLIANSSVVPLFFMVLYLLTTMIIYFISLGKLRKNKHSILKGAHDIL